MPSPTISKYKFWPAANDLRREHPEGLREELEGWQIFFITISAVIGVMIFFSDGEALELAGPSGALFAFVVVGVIAICVMECVSELIQMFPTPNAIVEFVRIFVDEDWAWVVGVAYCSLVSLKRLVDSSRSVW
ncbi:hypothetical protein MMC21_008202 [Puttea exsequens]|nr:hypothetical protein [Puttea exsequens]